MICPKCAGEDTRVMKTIKELKVIRWRKCSDCKYSFMTEEKPKADASLIEYNKMFEDEEKY